MLFVASFLAIAQAAAAPAAPDIEINAHVRARDLRIEQEGRAEARVMVEPSAGQRIAVERNLPKGQSHYRNLDLRLHVEGGLAGSQAGLAADADARAEAAPEPTTESPTGD